MRVWTALLLASALVPTAAGARESCSVTASPGEDVQRAIEVAARRRPATVCLRAGEFVLRRFLSIRHDGLAVRGEGTSTVLRLTDGTESPVIVIGEWERRVPPRPTSNVTIERLRIVGGGAGGGEAFPGHPYLTNSAVVVRAGRNVAIRGVSIGACRSACVLTELDSRRVTIEHDDIGGSVWDGIALNRTSGARAVGNTIHDNTAAGISAEHLTDSVVAGNVVSGNKTHGLYLSDSYRNTITDNGFTGNVLSGVFVTCAVRSRGPVVRCWKDSMSGGNVLARNRFVDNRVGYMIGADASASCRRRGYAPNRSTGDLFVRNPREDARANAFGACVLYRRPGAITREGRG